MTMTAAHRGEARISGPHPRRIRRSIAAMLMAIGLVLLGTVAWQYWGTNWVSHRKQERIVATINHEWDQHHRGNDPVEVDEGKAFALVRIPRFGDNYVIPVLEGTSDEVLSAGYGHFEDAARPGGVGNYALAAHRVTHGEPLRRMPELQPGDEVVVETRTKVFTYVLDTGGDDLVVDFTEGWVIDPLPKNPDVDEAEPQHQRGQRLLTLTTCAELFHTDKRMVAFGHLVTSKWKR